MSGTGASDSTLRVTHVISGLTSGGAEGVLARLAPAMAAAADGRGVRSTVISLRDEGVHGSGLRQAGITVEAIGMDRGRLDLRWIPRLLRAVRTSRPDVVQTWLYHGDLLGGIAGRLVGRPVVWNVRQMLGPEGPPTHRRLVATCARLSRIVPRSIVAVSEAARDDHIRAGYDAARFRVIPNGFDLDAFQPDAGARAEVRRELGLAPDALLLGLVARDDPHKDHESAIEALALLRRRWPDIHLVACGEGVDPDNERLAAALRSSGVADACRLLGARRDMPRLQAAWDVALSTSINEGLSNAIGEALACGVPAVVTEGGATADLVGEAGVAVPARDPAAVAAAVSALLARPPDQRAALSRTARHAAATHSMERAVASYRDLYQEVVEGDC